MPLEDLSTFTESDPLGHWAQTATRNTGTGVTRAEDSYVYKDYEAAHFGNIKHLLTIYCSAISADTALMGVWAITDTVGSYADLANDALCLYFYRTVGSENRLYLREKGGLTDYYVFALATAYYLTIERTGTSLTCKIYSDSARTTLLDTLSVTISSGVATYQYLQVGFSREAAGAMTVTGYCENLDICEGSISGVTRDSGGDTLGSCIVWLFKTSDKSYKATTTSHATTGAYSFTGLETGPYFLTSRKDGSPNVMAASDDNISEA